MVTSPDTSRLAVGGIIVLIGAMSSGFAIIVGKLNTLRKEVEVRANENDQELGEKSLSRKGVVESGKSIELAPVNPVGQLAEIDGQEVGVIDLGASISSTIRIQMNENTLRRGEPFASGGVLGTAALPVIGAGSTAASSLLAGNVFLATANPATLMAIKGGVGSAIMSGGKIVGHAPFISAGSALIPVVAPVMFFMITSAMMMSARFDRVQFSLDKLMEAVAALLKRELAEDYGLVLSANARLQDIMEEFEGSRRFTEDMKIRLALVERDLSSMHQKYEAITNGGITDDVQAQLAPSDQHIWALSAIASINVDRLRLRLDLQENPDDLVRSVRALNRKLDEYETGFRSLLEENPLLEYQKELEQSVEVMSWWNRNVARRKDRKKLEESAEETLRIRADELPPVLLDIQTWVDSISIEHGDYGLDQSIIYYREDEGKGELKAYYTSDVRVDPSTASSSKNAG